MRGMHEVTPINDTYCSGLGAIEDLGSAVRFHFYVKQTPEDGGPQERVTVAKLILPKDSVPDTIMQALGTIHARLSNALEIAAGGVAH